jgi:hypothetical protein
MCYPRCPILSELNLLKVIERTPPGKPVDETYVFFFLIIVLLVGFYNNVIGTNLFHGALMLHLVIPTACRSAPCSGRRSTPWCLG